VTGGWKNLHNIYSSPSRIRMIKSKRMRLVGHVARMGGGGGSSSSSSSRRRRIHIGYWWESQKEGDH
jgi:hypothetical protein